MTMKPTKRDLLLAVISGTLGVGGCQMPDSVRVPFLHQKSLPNKISTDHSGPFREASFRSVTQDQSVAVGVPVVSEIIAAQTNAPMPKQGSSELVEASDALAWMSQASDPLAPLPALGDGEPADEFIPESEIVLGSVDQQAAIDLDFVSALAAVGGQHPAVGLARWRVQEAYARWDQARILWIPTLQAGLSFHRHDGNYQASNGDIVDVNRNSLQAGLGTGATGAGTTPRPGLNAQYHLADAIFQPDIAQKRAWATQHAAQGVNQRQLLQAAIDYLQWLSSHLEYQIIKESRQRTADMAKVTGDFATAGQGLQADADRLQTELALIDDRLLQASERIEVSGATLVQTLSLPAGQRIVPRDPTVAPIEFVSLTTDRSQMIATALAARPELKESQALVSAACAAHRRQRWAPFVPSVLLGFSTGGFGGGLANQTDNVDGRYDFDAAVAWEARQLGLGERAARRETSAQVQQARFEAARVMDQVAREVSEFHSQAQHRFQRIELCQRSIESAKHSYERNLQRIRDGQGLPIETLQSLQALEQSQLAYLRAVVEYNRAQFQLQWAMGWPLSELPPSDDRDSP